MYTRNTKDGQKNGSWLFSKWSGPNFYKPKASRGM